MEQNYYIGTSGWTYEHWKGRFYPAGLARSKWFHHYIQHFNAVEINATFYRKFKDQTYAKWKNQVDESFRYVLKAPRIITHRKYLADSGEDIKSFVRSAYLLGDRLGLILLQLAPRTKYNPDLLRSTIQSFDNPRKLAVEFRNDIWLSDEVHDILSEYGVIYCNVDSPKSKLNDWITSDIGYFRLHGRGKWYSYNYSEKELEEISSLAKDFACRGAKNFYIFFNNDFEGYAPANALLIMDFLGVNPRHD